MGLIQRLTFLGTLFLILSCTQSRVKKYEGALEPLIDKASQNQVNAVLGNPVFCRQESRYEMCEYRTAAGHNAPVPDMFRKSESLGPDLSPYEYFDVLLQAVKKVHLQCMYHELACTLDYS